MANTIRLKVVTPERKVFDAEVNFFSLRGGAGELGILPGHIPLFTTVKPGLLHYKVDGEERILAVMEGFLDVQPKLATVLTDAAELGEEIDAARAKLARDKSEALASKMGEAASQAALERALVRLKALDMVGSLKGARR